MKNARIIRIISFIVAVLIIIPIFPVSANEPVSGRMKALIQFADNALKYARNLKGSTYPNLFVDGLNVETYEPVVWKMSGKDYYPSNFLGQQNFMRVLFGLSSLTDNPEYKEIAREQYKFYFANLTDKNGLLYSGAHAFVDVMSGKVITTGAHETKDYQLPWELMYESDPEGTIKYIEAFWNAHVYDWSTLAMNRHGYYDGEMGELWNSVYEDPSVDFKQQGTSLAFQCTADDLIEAAFFITKKTGDPMPTVWAKRMLQKYIDTVNPETGLNGGEYGLYSDEEGGDRAQAQFGPEFGEVALHYNYINRNTIKITAGYAPEVLLPYIEETGDQAALDYVVSQLEGVADHVYDVENNRYKTPIFSDGTSLQGYELLRDGYYGREGSKLPEYEGTFPLILKAAIYAHKVSGSEKIWNLARDYAKNESLGDIGTAPGENLSLNFSTSSSSSYYALAILELYKNTGNQEYLDLAVKMGDNMLKRYVRNGLFVTAQDRAYTKLDSEEAVAVLNIEAAVQGKLDLVENRFGHAPIDLEFDGVGRIQDGTVIYAKKQVAADSVAINRKEVTLTVNDGKVYDFNDTKGHWAQKQIKQMAAAGVMDGRDDGNFYPDDHVSRGEFIKMVNSLCSLRNTELPLIMYDDVSKNDWYYNDAVAAKNANIIDYNMTLDNKFSGDKVITREEMASILVRALKYVNSNIKYGAKNALYKFEDSDKVSKWAAGYADIACNYRIMNGTSGEYFSPDLPVTRAQAACAIKGLENIISNDDIVTLSAAILPETCTNKTIIWKSSNENIVEVDENGRLYPVDVGEATVTATCGAVSDTAKVTVQGIEGWMIKKVSINGVKFEAFSPNHLEYTYDLPVGTKDKPIIIAESFDGARVLVSNPAKLPGTAMLYLDKEGSQVYNINFTTDKIEYIINEDYNGFKLDTNLMDALSGKVVWQIGTDYRDKVKITGNPIYSVIPGESTVDANGESTSEEVIAGVTFDSDDKCFVIPYDTTYKYLGEIRGRFLADAYLTGEAAPDEDLVIVFDADVMLDAPFNKLSIRLGSTTGYTWAQRITFTGDGMFVEKTGDTIGSYAKGEFNNIKIVIDKKTLAADYYFNGVKVLTGQAPLNITDKIDVFMFHMPAGLDAQAKVYVDNLKVYEVSRDAVLESFTR